MNESINEAIEAYVKDFINSDKFQKTMLISFSRIFCNNLKKTTDSLTEQISYEFLTFYKLKSILLKIEEILSADNSLISEKNCMDIGNALIEISDILNHFQTGKPMISDIFIKINTLQNTILNLKPHSKGMSIEEFLAIKEDENIKSNKYDDFSEREQESILKKYGYSVAANSQLSSKQRKLLLKKLIDTKIVSKGYVISYLKYNIRINGKKANNEFAVIKWQEDLDFINNL